MRILFVQISDTHCKSGEANYNKIDKAVTALKSLGPVESAVLIFSGDLTDTASKNEFKAGRRVLGRLLNKLGELVNSWIPSLIVPGNHDMYLPDESRGIDEIMNWHDNKCQDQHLGEELCRLGTFFEYAHRKKCFTEDDGLCQIQMLHLNGVKIQVCLLNSAPFSTKRPDDKQAHYFPSYIGDKLVRDPTADIKITVIHHNYEWFEWSSKETLRKSFASDDIVFSGHDHLDEMLTVKDGKGTSTNIIVGGKFTLDLLDNAAFNAVIYDSEAQQFERYQFDWIPDQQIFVHTKCDPINLKSTTLSLVPCEPFLDTFLEDKQQLATRFTEYYVFPKLVPENKDFDSEYSECIDEDGVFASLLRNRYVRISGKTNSGKSTLIKYLYYKSIERGFSPLYIEQRKYDSRIEKMFRDMFELQYGEKQYGYESFMQLDFSKRIIFVDDFDRITNDRARENLFNYIFTYGGLLVYSVSEGGQSLEDIVKEKLKVKDINALQIAPFLTEKREELVLKVSSLEKYKKEDQAQAVIMALNYLVQNQAGFFTLTPGNLLQYIKFFLSDGTQEGKGIKTLSLVFETNIRNSIIECVDTSDAVIYLSALEYLANSMYFELHSEVICLTQFENVIERFNERRRTNLNSKNFFDACQKAKILGNAPSSFDICFCDKNAFAYFVAKYVNSELERDPLNQESISYIMNHICFGINDAIVLFLSYIRNNSHIILKIASTANDILQGYPELNFDNHNIPFLTAYRSPNMPVPTAKEVKEHKNEIAKIEEARHEAVKFEGIFDYDEADVEKEKYRILRALKYTRLIGQALVDQYGALDSEELEGMVSSIYSNTQKILYAVLKPYQDHYDELISGFSSFVKEAMPEEKITDREIRKIFTDSAIVLVLNVMNDIAYNCSNSRTISVLNEMRMTTSNQRVHNLMMTENMGNTATFVTRALSLNESYKGNPFIQSLIKQIACKHIYYTYKIDYRQIDRLVSGNILSAKGSKAMLVQHQRQITEGKTKDKDK